MVGKAVLDVTGRILGLAVGVPDDRQLIQLADSMTEDRQAVGVSIGRIEVDPVHCQIAESLIIFNPQTSFTGRVFWIAE